MIILRLCLLFLLSFAQLHSFSQNDSTELEIIPGSDFIRIIHPFEDIIPPFVQYANKIDSSYITFSKWNYTLEQKKLKDQWTSISILYNNDTVRQVIYRKKQYILFANGLKVKAKVKNDGCLKKLVVFAYEYYLHEGKYSWVLRIRKRNNDLKMKEGDYYHKSKSHNPYLIFNDLENFISLFRY